MGKQERGITFKLNGGMTCRKFEKYSTHNKAHAEKEDGYAVLLQRPGYVGRSKEGGSMVEATEEEEKWLKRAKRLLKDTPKGCWIFVDGNFHLMRCKEGGGRAVLWHDGMDQDYIVGTVSGPDMDGGDW